MMLEFDRGKPPLQRETRPCVMTCRAHKQFTHTVAVVHPHSTMSVTGATFTRQCHSQYKVFSVLAGTTSQAEKSHGRCRSRTLRIALLGTLDFGGISPICSNPSNSERCPRFG